MSSKKTNIRSFSLVELMVVMAIVALLASAAVPNYIGYLQRASVLEGVAMLANYKQALALFWSTEARLPGNGDTLDSTPANLTFGVTITNTASSNNLPDSIQSVLLSASGNGVLITIVVQGNEFATTALNNRTLVLGAKPNGGELAFACGNFTTNAALITDIGFTPISTLPSGCNFNGVGPWLNT